MRGTAKGLTGSMQLRSLDICRTLRCNVVDVACRGWSASTRWLLLQQQCNMECGGAKTRQWTVWSGKKRGSMLLHVEWSGKRLICTQESCVSRKRAREE